MSKAEAKRRFQIGTKWKFVYSDRRSSSNPQYREVVHKQTNAVAFAKSDNPEHIALAKSKPHANATWLYFDQKFDKYTIKGDAIVCTCYDEDDNAQAELVYEPWDGRV